MITLCQRNVIGILAVAWSVFFPLGVSAQSMSFADAADRLAAACGKDMDANCKGMNLGNGRMRACLAKNADSVSAQCKETFAAVLDGIDKRAKARVAVIKTCDTDIRRLCGSTVQGDGQILECMLTAQRGVSARCNQAITEAGYR